jgi:glutathionylspermidine synthase
MTRLECPPRPDFQRIVRDQGLVYHTNADGSPYWKEESYYAFSAKEVDRLYAAAKELHQMFLAAAGRTLEKKNGLTELGIPSALHDVIRRAWEDDHWEFYGRFDLTLDARGVPKLIEYNADTPTGLLEASIIQWYWKEDRFPDADQFNSIHEGFVARWKELIEHRQLAKEITHFTSVANHPEDRMTVGYLAQTAEEAGIPTDYLSINLVGWDRNLGEFVDEQNQSIRQIFKLYPWEWMGVETFAPQLGLTRWKILEPAWKAIFASKRLLLTLQQLYPNHPHLLRVSDQPMQGNYVTKPVFGREGANVALYKSGVEIDKRDGPHTDDDFIFQEYAPLLQAKPEVFAQCGVWMAGPEPVGMGIREDVRPILGNTSQFVPHIIA